MSRPRGERGRVPGVRRGPTVIRRAVVILVSLALSAPVAAMSASDVTPAPATTTGLSPATATAPGPAAPPTPASTSGLATARAATAALVTAPSPATASATTPAPADTLAPLLTGVVRASGFRGGEGLPGAIIELRQDGRILRVTSDPQGVYRLAGVRPGRARLHVFHVAALPSEFEVSLPRDGILVVDVELERRVLELPPVVVRPGLPVPTEVTPSVALGGSGSRTAGIRMSALAATSGMVESGLGSVTGTPPGGEPGEEPGEAGRVLFMRGSTVDSRQVLLDGAPILTPFHLAGVVPSFDAGVLEGARLHLGGAPARHDGGLSYILEVETRDPRGGTAALSAALDPVAGRLAAELPLGRAGGVLGAWRGIHGAGTGEGFPYHYSDGLLRLSATPGPHQDLGITLFRNREGVRLGEMGGGLLVPAGDLASWGNQSVSGRWRLTRPDLGVEVTGAHSAYDASLPLAWPDPILARSHSERSRAELVVSHPNLRWGASLERQELRWELRSVAREVETMVERGVTRGRADRAGGFLETEVAPAPDLRFRGGIRGDWFGVDGSLRVAPRAALEWLLSEDASLSLSAGRFQETLPLGKLEARAVTAEEVHLRWTPALEVSTADHVVLGLEQRLTPEVEMQVTGFVKRFHGSGSTGPLQASGTDLRVARQGDRLDSWVGYALTWVWASEGREREFAGRHLVSAGLRVELDRGGALGVSLGYGAGLPLTGVAMAPDGALVGTESGVPVTSNFGFRSAPERHASQMAASPMEVAVEDAFLRLDLDASWPVRTTLGGRPTEFRPYLRVLNALDRRDALFHYFDRWRDEEMRPLASRPFLPLVGVEWRF
jgi:hypothetical protein